MNMFCYQCEQAANGKGCDIQSICGKDPESAGLQDLLVHAAQGISIYADAARKLGARDRAIDLFVIEALFTTVTNVNFDAAKLEAQVREAARVRDRAKALYEAAAAKAGVAPKKVNGASAWTPAGDTAGLLSQAEKVGVASLKKTYGEDVAGLRNLLLYGLKGTAAYAEHAQINGQESDDVYAYFHEALAFLARTDLTADDLLPAVLKCGEVNLKVMELLDTANTTSFGHPVPTKVRVTAKKGKAILVSGHELKDLLELLKQTEGKGINVYTHGEMLPAHGYPELNKFKHLAGNYGGAWQDQLKEFSDFPGAILMTTNCIQKPANSYKARLFTSGLVEWPGVEHISNRDFSAVIAAALEAPGFAADEPEQSIVVGFGHQTVLGVAGTVIDAVKSGAIKHFFLVGGCDGAKPGRNYYTEFTEQVPNDCVILTLACGKFRFNKLDFGEIGGLPRLLDVGQCNDAYSAIKIASALAGAFNCGVNDLPLSLVLSWYEQKAVCILLTLLHLGIKNIRLGPSLPAFVTPPVLNVLVEKFGIKPISTPEKDLAEILKH